MRNTIRCCISCILPCGALDVIRIVHSNGHVEEISGSITARDILRAHPKHVLKKPSSPPSDDHDASVVSAAAGSVVPATVAKIVVVPPDAELQRGKIYFLMPVSDADAAGKSGRTKKKRDNSGHRRNHHHHHHRRHRHGVAGENNGGGRSGEVNHESNYVNNISLLMSDRYLSEILSEKVSTQRERRRGRVGVWRPHLESISESMGDD